MIKLINITPILSAKKLRVLESLCRTKLLSPIEKLKPNGDFKFTFPSKKIFSISFKKSGKSVKNKIEETKIAPVNNEPMRIEFACQMESPQKSIIRGENKSMSLT